MLPKNIIGRMFSSIVKRYDLINTINSLGLDDKWRKILRRFSRGRILDVGTGSGKVLKFLKGKKYGIDISKEMIKIAKTKTDAHLIISDAHNLPFKDESFDTITLAFVYRNLIDRKKFLKEAHRVLKKDGILLILDFSLPENNLLKLIYKNIYLIIVNFIGYILSGNYFAYKYLRESIIKFSNEDIVEEISLNGFKAFKVGLTFNVATLYICVKD